MARCASLYACIVSPKLINSSVGKLWHKSRCKLDIMWERTFIQTSYVYCTVSWLSVHHQLFAVWHFHRSGITIRTRLIPNVSVLHYDTAVTAGYLSFSIRTWCTCQEKHRSVHLQLKYLPVKYVFTVWVLTYAHRNIYRVSICNSNRT